MRKNIDRMALSPNGTLLVTVDKGNWDLNFKKTHREAKTRIYE
jgi:hypothetical protein